MARSYHNGAGQYEGITSATLLEIELRRRGGLYCHNNSFITHDLKQLIYLDVQQ